jgi:hypothetical protein
MTKSTYPPRPPGLDPMIAWPPDPVPEFIQRKVKPGEVAKAESAADYAMRMERGKKDGIR